MMVRELAASLAGQFINTPDYQILLKHPCCGKRHDWVHISDSTSVKIAESSTSAEQFDLKLTVGGYPILVDLVYKGKPPAAVVEADLQAAKAGVLALDCDSFLVTSFRRKRSGRFSEAVADFVLKTGLRKWRYHPRQAAKIETARESHQCKREFNPISIREPYTYPKPAVRTRIVHRKPATPQPQMKKPKEPKKYYCVLCDREWMHDFTGPLSCPGCHSHLYGREV
jgi:hypothetical protein